MTTRSGSASSGSISKDAASATRALARPAGEEESVSTDAVGAVEQSSREADAETSTSTDAVLVAQGRNLPDLSESTDDVSTVDTTVRYIADTSTSFDNIVAEMNRPEIGNYEFMVVDPLGPVVPFGGLQVITGKFNPGSFEVADQDSAAALGDFRMFGSDKHTPPMWNWSLFTNLETPEAATEWADALAQIWKAKRHRQGPEGVLPLRYRMNNRVRRVYGRPRRFTPVYDSVQKGKIKIECDFALAEDIYYDDDEHTVTATLGQALGMSAGIVLPQPVPWRFNTPAPPKTEQAIIGGTSPTWVDIDFYGPSANAWVKIGDLTWGLDGEIPIGQRVTVSGKPWSMGVRRDDGTPVPGMLDPRARLSALQLDPGVYSVQFGGWDNTGSSRVVIRWRNANQTL